MENLKRIKEEAANVLERVAEMFGEDPSTWTQHCYARDVHERAVNLHDPSANSFCMIGAIARINGVRSSVVNISPVSSAAIEAITARLKGINRGVTIFEFNDSTNLKNVIGLCLDAAADLRKK